MNISIKHQVNFISHNDKKWNGLQIMGLANLKKETDILCWWEIKWNWWFQLLNWPEIFQKQINLKIFSQHFFETANLAQLIQPIKRFHIALLELCLKLNFRALVYSMHWNCNLRLDNAKNFCFSCKTERCINGNRHLWTEYFSVNCVAWALRS